MIGCLTKVTPPMANTAHLARVNSSLSSLRPGQATDLERSSVERSVMVTIPTLIIATQID